MTPSSPIVPGRQLIETVSDETSRATVSRGYMGNDAEWCYWDDEYSEEGSCGPFNTLGEAVMHASDAGYNEFAVLSS